MARDLRTYSSYRQMRNRCLNTKNHNYHLYGGRGIKICDRWLESYSNFLEDMGIRPEDSTLDRIDNDADYCLENCRWASQAVQCYNRDSSHWHVMYYDNAKGYTDEQLLKFEDIPDLRSTIEWLGSCYPLSKIEGGIKLIENKGGIAAFGILKVLSDKDLSIGGKHQMLTLVRPLRVGVRNLIIYEWRCDCGNVIETYSRYVVYGDKKSCGCHRQDVTDEERTTKLRWFWSNFRSKLINPRHKSYHSTGGGTGISICDEWGTFATFVEDMGYPPFIGATLILKPGETVYGKDTCYWQAK